MGPSLKCLCLGQIIRNSTVGLVKSDSPTLLVTLWVDAILHFCCRDASSSEFIGVLCLCITAWLLLVAAFAQNTRTGASKNVINPTMFDSRYVGRFCCHCVTDGYRPGYRRSRAHENISLHMYSVNRIEWLWFICVIAIIYGAKSSFLAVGIWVYILYDEGRSSTGSSTWPGVEGI